MTISLIGASIVVLVLSLLSLRTMFPLIETSLRKKHWKTVVMMICFFILGYAATLILILEEIQIVGLLLIGIIYFAGTLFVYYVVNNAKMTIKDLVRINNEKNQAEKSWKQAEEKYSRLFHNSSDVLFILDHKYTFITINQVIRRFLGYSPEETIGKNIMQLIFNADEHNSIDRDVIFNNIQELVISKKPVIFKTGFRHKYNPEPIYLQVTLEFIEFASYFEIIGKASQIVDDILVDAFQSEKQQYIIGNQLSMAEHMSQRICRNLAKYTSEPEANKMRICVRELLINAIEHGNLGISFAEKTAAMLNDDYYNFILTRSKEAQYKNKKIMIEYSLTRDRIEIIIEDSGEGFNHAEFTGDHYQDVLLSHGRGIMLTRKQFTSITYNEKGNRVTLVKKW